MFAIGVVGEVGRSGLLRLWARMEFFKAADGAHRTEEKLSNGARRTG